MKKQSAPSLSGALSGFADVVWKGNQGPFENTLRLLPYIAVPFLGGVGSLIGAAALLFTKHYLGISLRDFGREVDSALGFGPGEVPENIDEKKLEDYLVQRLSSTTASFKYGDYYISKRAGLASGSWKLIKLLAKYLPKLVMAAGTAFAGSAMEPGLEKIDEYIGQLSGKGKDKIDRPDIKEKHMVPQEDKKTMEDVLVQKRPETVKDFAENLKEKYKI